MRGKENGSTDGTGSGEPEVMTEEKKTSQSLSEKLMKALQNLLDMLTGKRPKKTKTGKSKGKKKRSIKWSVISPAFFALCLCFLIFIACPLYKNAGAIGQVLGNSLGNVVGTAVGSYRGVTEGVAKGKEAGREEGLSAKDTVAAVGEKVQEVGNLDVLLAEVKMNTANEVGDDPNSAVLSVFKADAIFYVNLKKAEVQRQDDTHMIIKLPVPEVSLAYNEEESKILAEWKKHFWSGDDETGYKDYLKSRSEISSKSIDEIANYDVLSSQARDSAEKQVSQLVRSICGERMNVTVLFEDETALPDGETEETDLAVTTASAETESREA